MEMDGEIEFSNLRTTSENNVKVWTLEVREREREGEIGMGFLIKMASNGIWEIGDEKESD